MTLVLGLFCDPTQKQPHADAVFSALALDNDASLTFELGRAETGATCAILHEGDGGMSPAGLTGWRIHVPLVRSPTSARDVIPPIAEALAHLGGLGPLDGEGPLSIPELLAVWDRAHANACRALTALCEAQGSPLPPHLPRAELERLHGWLLAMAENPDVVGPILGVDQRDGQPTTLVVALPIRGRVPPVPGVLLEIDDETQLFTLDATPGPDGFITIDPAVREKILVQEGTPIGRARIVTPVEIVDAESLAG